MSRKGKPDTVSATAPRPQLAGLPELLPYLEDLDQWPHSWMGWSEDVAPGQKIVGCFIPFLLHLVRLHLGRKTIRKHVDNLWLLGGQMIRDLNYTPSLRKVPVEQLLADLLQDGGPLLYHCDSEETLSSFESTCRRFHRFLLQQPPQPRH